ncbi:MAG: outer membrane beta-barrel protein [Myxococcales bacterium]|nr:outer membrane beta-barrel protein [Myxococcales bacterium]MCB9522374.1 outer membrane beta-barrel protein [Myxococcales bacterium]
MRPTPMMFLTALSLAALAAPAGAQPNRAVTSAWHWSSGQAELGPRLTQLTLSDDDSGQSLPMGGVGGYFRYRLSERLGVEASLDLLFSDEVGDQSPGEVVRLTMPLTASGMFYLFPNSRFQMYLLAGLGVAAHVIRYDALGQEVSFATPVGQLGLGVQYRVDDLRFDLGFRSLVMHRDGEELEVEALPEGDFEPRAVAYAPRTGDRTVTGGMITLGVHFGL